MQPFIALLFGPFASLTPDSSIKGLETADNEFLKIVITDVNLALCLH